MVIQFRFGFFAEQLVVTVASDSFGAMLQRESLVAHFGHIDRTKTRLSAGLKKIPRSRQNFHESTFWVQSSTVLQYPLFRAPPPQLDPRSCQPCPGNLHSLPQLPEWHCRPNVKSLKHASGS
jgi:hypothetical protein